MEFAAEAGFPLMNVLGTLLLFFGLALFVWLLITVFRDLFGRGDVPAWTKTGWVLLVVVLPIIGSLIYLGSRSQAMGEQSLARAGATQLRADEYVGSMSGHGGYRGIHDVTRTDQAMRGPIRPA